MAGLAERVAQVREEIGPGCELLVAVKYLDDLDPLVAAGVTVVGENRAQALIAKQERWPQLRWHFIGQLQSRKVKDVVGRVELIHSLASDSALEQLGRHAPPETEVLVQVNIAGEAGKAGIDPGALGAFIESCPVRVSGLMTMPPFTDDPERSRPHFAALRALADEHGLHHCSMGTSQDYAVAAQEGATIVRVGAVLFAA